MYLRPRQLKTLFLQIRLESFGQLLAGMNSARRLLGADCLRCYGSRRFADIPFHGMQAVAAVSDVRCADIFASGQQVFYPFRNERAERNLEWERTDIDIVGRPGRGMQIDAIGADAHRILERRRLGAPTHLCADVLLEYGEFSLNTPRFANVDGFGKSILGADDVFAQPKPLPALATVQPRRLGLHPVKQRQTQLLRLPQIFRLLFGRSG
jgi:hypothetical protein